MGASPSVLVLLAVVGAAPALAKRPTAASWRDEVQRLRNVRVVPPAPSAKTGARPVGGGSKAALARLRAAQRPAREEPAAMIVENEPNNSAKTADSVARGGQATGVVNSEGDVDFWFVDLTAGQFFSVDVDAKDVGSLLDPVLQLFAPGTSPFLPLGPVGRPGRHFRAV